MMRRPCFHMALVALAGAVAGRAVQVPFWVGVGLWPLFLIAAGFVYWRLREKRSDALANLLRRLVFGGLFCMVFFQQNETVRREEMGLAQVKQLSGAGRIRFRGTVAEEPAMRGNRMVLVVRDVKAATGAQEGVGKGNPSYKGIACRLQVVVEGPASRTLPLAVLPIRGQRLEFTGTVLELPPPSHPDLFDYRSYLLVQSVGGQVFVDRHGELRRAPEEDARLESALFGCLSAWRRAMLRVVEENMDAPSAGLLQAMLLGDMSELDGRTRAILARVGASHIFSVSGLHTSYLAFLIFLLCRAFQIPPRPTAWVTIAFLCIYCALVGFLAPVGRSTIMAFCLLIPYLARRAVDSLNALSIAALLTILFDPLAPFRLDFQFSYLCVLGIVTLTPALNEMVLLPMKERSYRRQRLLAIYNHWVGQGLSLVMASQLAVLPLLSMSYHQFSLVGFPANLVLVPFSSLVLAAGWALAFTGPLAPALAAALGWVGVGFSHIFMVIAKGFAWIPGGMMALPPFPWWLAGLYYLLLFSGPHLLMRQAPGQREVRRSKLLLRLAMIAALISWWPLAAPTVRGVGEAPGDLAVTMLDVDQGDCFLLEFPNGKSLLLDTGARFAARRVQQYLYARGTDRISALLVTHSDGDHIGAAGDVVEDFPVIRLLEGPGRSASQNQKRLDEAVRARGTPTARVGAGLRLAGISPAQADVLWPGEGASKASANAQSVILRLRYGAVRFLFMGDADGKCERALLEQLGEEGVQADVLKVAHHGSITSTGEAFVSAVRPSLALLSVGARNTYGHPSPIVISRLRAAGCAIASTAERGVVEVRTDGRRLWVRSGRPAMKNDLP